MDGNGWYGDRYKNNGQSVHFFDFNEIKTEIRYRQHKKHKHTHIQRYREWSMVHLINVLLSTNVIMNKRYYARWNIISYIKMHFNQLRQLFYPLFMARICLCLCYGVCSLSSLFRALVSCCFGSFRFHLFLFWKNWVEKKYVVLAFYISENLPFMDHGCIRRFAHFLQKVVVILFARRRHCSCCCCRYLFTIWLFWLITSHPQSSKASHLISCVHITELIFTFTSILHGWKPVIQSYHGGGKKSGTLSVAQICMCGVGFLFLFRQIYPSPLHYLKSLQRRLNEV